MPVVVNEVEVLDTPPPDATPAPPRPAVEPFADRLRRAERDAARCRGRIRAD